MKYDFDTLVKRRPANLKQSAIPPEVLAAGNVSFDGAEPDFPTAPVIRDAVRALAENGLYGFTLCDDTYRERVCWWMEHSRGVKIRPEWVVPTLGTIYSVATAIRLCCGEGEGVILAPPVYNRYAQAARRLERRVVECPMQLRDGRYHMDFDALEEAMRDPSNRLFVFCNPHNPSGQIWSMEELARIAGLAEQYDVTVFSDEIFADNCYGGRRCPCYLEVPGAAARGIAAISLGKSFHFTGVNHANILIADEDLRARFTDRRTRDHYGSIDPLAYECVLAAYTPEGLDWLRASNDYVEKNMHLIREFFREQLPEVPVYGGEGGYILWMDWRARFESEESLTDFLYRRAFFHVDVGSSYGAERFTRMCTASPRRCIAQALVTLRRALEQ